MVSFKTLNLGYNASTNTYDTLTDLRLAIGQASSSISLLGINTINDGGAGQFYWSDTSTALDNGYSIITPLNISTGRWIRGILSSDTTTPEYFGAKGDGTTDDTIAIQSAINTNKTVVFSKKVYLISSNLVLNQNQVLIGNEATIKSNSAINFLLPETNCNINDLIFLGAGRTSNVTQTGIFIDGGTSFINKLNITINNCTFQDLGANGIRITRVVDPHKGELISNCKFISCKKGLYIDERGEYVKVSSSTFCQCDINIHIIGGNVCVTGCTITDAIDTNILISPGSNDSHGVIVGCLINHGQVYNVKIENIITKDFLFSGCDFYIGDIYLQGTQGVRFESCSISVTNIYEDGAIDCLFRNVQFMSIPTINANYNSSQSKVLYIDCIWPSSLSIDSSLRINGALLGIIRNTNYTIPSGVENYIPWDVNFNSISGNPFYTLESFYLDSFRAFDFTKKVSPKRSWFAQGYLNLSIGNSTTYDDTKVEVYLYDIDNGNRVGIFSKGIEYTSGSNKYRIYTYSGDMPSIGRVHVRVDNNTGTAITLFANSNLTPSYGRITGF